jgi:two-component system, NarL family, nitrate/nitrite response regulator NarL
MHQISLVLIDDQPVFIEGFRALCERVPNFCLVAAATDAAALPSVVAEHKPDILFVDVANPGISPDIIRSVSNATPKVKLVALTAARSIALAIQTLDAGAFGYVLKQSSGEELTLAIEALGRGERFITHGFSSKLVSALQDAAVRKKAALAINLSIRESQIARFLMAGKTNKEIAHCLRISERTVKHYMTHLMQKLNARNRMEVAIAARALAHADTSTPDSVH